MLVLLIFIPICNIGWTIWRHAKPFRSFADTVPADFYRPTRRKLSLASIFLCGVIVTARSMGYLSASASLDAHLPKVTSATLSSSATLDTKNLLFFSQSNDLIVLKRIGFHDGKNHFVLLRKEKVEQLEIEGTAPRFW